ncbi:MAG TPA: AsmA-like C-terminal region-containing protein, partial [Candidatus Acidoferrum sp.]|nr:AsmA-like C-terminal region-containing protein [Candidatus Acidoferrum sp.]
SSPGVVSPWGRGNDVNVSVQLAPSPAGAFVADVKLQARDAETRWGNAGSLVLEAHVAPSFTRWTPTNAHLSLTVKQARTPWASANHLTLVADFAPSPANDAASLAHYVLRAQRVESKWAKATRLELESDVVLTSSNLWPQTAKARLQFAGAQGASMRAGGGNVEAALELPPLEAMEFANTNLSWWTRLDRVRAGLNVRTSDVHASRLDMKQLVFVADWRAPLLSLRDVRSMLYDGTVEGSAALDTQTRRLSATARTTVDPHRIQSLLDTNTQKWLALFTWEKPPLLSASAAVTLPVWTNGATNFVATDWNKDVLPTLVINGGLEAGPTTFRSVPVISARSAFAFSNLAWHLPNLAVTRPEGRAFIAHTGHSRTREFTFDINSTIDPKAIGPLLTKGERALLDWFVFTNMPHLRMQMAGRWHEPEKISLRADLAVTNVSFRDLPVREARTLITLTNQQLTFEKPFVVRSEGTGRADAVRVDVRKKTLFIDNATGSLDPAAITHAVGPGTEALTKPYHFVNPPQGRAHGFIDTEDVSRTDVHFHLAGGPFEWMNFRFQQITGNVHWLGKGVLLSNVHGSLHGGKLEGSAKFDFTKQTVFSFHTTFEDINLHTLVTDFGNKTNRVEGALNGLLVVTNAVGEDMKSWFGYGNLAVSEGLLWDFPIFGLFSPMLNAVKEGTGNSRAKEATATIIITNSVIHSGDLVIHASGMRLKGEGAVDFDTRVNGKMTAQLFRDAPGIGGLMATVLWPVTKIFEYKVTGTLARPQAAPLYIPSFISQPLKTLKGLGGGEKEENNQ